MTRELLVDDNNGINLIMWAFMPDGDPITCYNIKFFKTYHVISSLDRKSFASMLWIYLSLDTPSTLVGLELWLENS